MHDSVQLFYVVVSVLLLAFCVRSSVSCHFGFQNIDVDQIVEQYQSTCTPQPSISKLPPVTPSLDKGNFVRLDESCLPPELCSNCNHGFKVCMPSSFCSSWGLFDLLST